MRRLPFSVRLRFPVMGVTERSGWLIEGPAGWGEWSPLPSWPERERRAAEAAADEAANLPFPPAARTTVAVNAMIPRLPPGEAALLALESGCGTVKVKVGDASSADRVAAVRAACGARMRVRLDANGAWDLDTARRELARLTRYDIELVEDPVASLEDLAALRRLVATPIAVESPVRTVADARRVRELDAADVIVLKPQRIGGVRAALNAAEEAGIPAIASSALETSVGLAAVVALAAALPEVPFAHGAGTAFLLERDVVTDPLIPEDGYLAVRRPTLDRTLLATA